MKRGFLYIIGENVNWCNLFGDVFFKSLKVEFLYNFVLLFLSLYLRSFKLML